MPTQNHNESFFHASWPEPEVHHYNFVRFRFLAASGMKMKVFWNIVPCSLVGVDRRFRGAYYLLHHGDDGFSTHL
jgi:hypothetical protein